MQLRTECTVCADGVFKQKLKMEASKMISRNKINRSFRVKLQKEASERRFSTIQKIVVPIFEKSLNLQGRN